MLTKPDTEYLANMAISLENQDLGAAVRILQSMLSTGCEIPVSRLAAIAQMTNDAWEASSKSILRHFKVQDGMVSHQILEQSRLPMVELTPRSRVGHTPEMPIVHPLRTQVVPTYVDRSMPERISIKSAAYKSIAELYRRCNQNENTARTVLTGLLKNWPEGDIYSALEAAARQTYIENPRGWIVTYLRNHSTPLTLTSHRPGHGSIVPPPRSRATHSIATPESLGVSATTAETIRQRNRSLKLNIPTPTGASE